ncbi:MAG: bifunctional phosphoribosylaminoimidazolecarboxamide formyltransferase/inosine monophosphate cyclohydrolase [Chloroflexi bacterium]|nr:bifunctional phosphoribosylaminoimidazolecarboxamide formyltransferase/inosine monophosphate cyclohydrolase [Chloroflexota bacterium]|tara:strand:+ start:57989 stop:59566 length:1578 start_codon:yes stop_codon:yes gene_type:complete
MRAILAVYDKEGIEEFAQNLFSMGCEIIATGGTAKSISDAGIPVTEIADLTGSPEMFGGRVKTLHPVVHGGILFRRGHEQDEGEAKKYSIPPIDLVVCNLYPFVEATMDEGNSFVEILEQIDIGGPTLIRASAKNHGAVLPIVDPDDYGEVIEILQDSQGDIEKIDLEYKRNLAAKAFQHVAHYDSLIAEFLRADDSFPEALTFAATKVEKFRYAENPHQDGAFYRHDSIHTESEGIGAFRQLHGKQMSYVNFLDADAAYNLVCDFEEPAVSIIKHTNPACFACSVEIESLSELYEQALRNGDSLSAYGGILATNRNVDIDFAKALREVRSPENGSRMFYEIVIAPSYEEEALEHLRKKSKDLRILEAPVGSPLKDRVEIRSVRGGFLVQESDLDQKIEFQTVSARIPSEEELADLLVAWKVCKHVKSNAVTFVKNQTLIGMGAGQPNRVASAELAKQQADVNAVGAVAATDALIPFPDTIEVCASAGCTVVAHTGGSIRDQESIETADELDISLVVTGIRHFRH